MIKAVREAKEGDLPGWLLLAAEIESLFGPMVHDPGFRAAVLSAIGRGDAFCIPGPGAAGEPLDGGVLVDRDSNAIAWLAVSRRLRGEGNGGRLLEASLARLDRSRPAVVETFAATEPQGIAARALYEKYGFSDRSPAGRNPAGFEIVEMVRIPSERAAPRNAP